MIELRRFDVSRALSDRFHAGIPGGAHTYAKGDDQYPQDTALIIVRGRGCRVWYVDGNEVKFAKNGSDVTTAAVKLARAATGRDMVAICGDHPFPSTDD